MIKCIIINNNIATENNIKNINDDNIYKKCNFKNNTDFINIKSWDYKNNTIQLWGKSRGTSNFKSKFFIYERDNINIYGKSIFLMKNDNDYLSLDINTFNNFFNISYDNNDNNNNNNNNNDNNNDNNDNDNNDNNDISSDSELTYELYCYSDEDI